MRIESATAIRSMNKGERVCATGNLERRRVKDHINFFGGVRGQDTEGDG